MSRLPLRLPPLHDLLAFEAAAAGQGIALRLKTLFEGYGANGVLVKPFTLEVWDRAYTIVLAPEAAHKPAVTLFTDWLRAEAGAVAVPSTTRVATVPP